MAVFASARAALDCAVSIEREMAARNDCESPPLLVRVGVHVGEAIRQKGDYFGRNVALAARVASCATGGEILVSESVRDLSECRDVGFERGPTVELRGFSGTWALYRVGWQAAEATGSAGSSPAEN
jgi:class 3 adenylate cyclase